MLLFRRRVFAINMKNLVSVTQIYSWIALKWLQTIDWQEDFLLVANYLFFFLPSCYSDSTKLIRIQVWILACKDFRIILDTHWYLFNSPHFRIYTTYSLIDYCCCYCFGFELIIVYLFVWYFFGGELKVYQLCWIIYSLCSAWQIP